MGWRFERVDSFSGGLGGVGCQCSSEAFPFLISRLLAVLSII